MPELPNPDSVDRPYRGVHLKCCNVYIRVYLNHQKSAFTGFCPKCAKQVRLEIVAEGGSQNQIFEAS